jgi:hypothetical protein
MVSGEVRFNASDEVRDRVTGRATIWLSEADRGGEVEVRWRNVKETSDKALYDRFSLWLLERLTVGDGGNERILVSRGVPPGGSLNGVEAIKNHLDVPT